MFPSVFAWQVHCMGPCVLLTAMVDDAVLCHSLQLQSKLSTAHMQSRVLTDAALQKYIQNGRSTTPAGINFVLPFSATRPAVLQMESLAAVCSQPEPRRTQHMIVSGHRTTANRQKARASNQPPQEQEKATDGSNQTKPNQQAGHIVSNTQVFFNQFVSVATRTQQQTTEQQGKSPGVFRLLLHQGQEHQADPPARASDPSSEKLSISSPSMCKVVNKRALPAGVDPGRT